MGRSVQAVLLAAICALALGLRCGSLRGVVIDDPLDAALLVDPGVTMSGRVGANHDVATTTVEVDGVDLVSALGLTPPFSDEGGVVLVGGAPVVVSGFSVTDPASGPHRVDLQVDGLPAGDHFLVISAFDPGAGELHSDRNDFARVGAFTQEATAVTSAGLPGGPKASSSEGVLANASLGQAAASGPVPTLGGQTIRSGHVEVAEQLAAGGSGP